MSPYIFIIIWLGIMVLFTATTKLKKIEFVNGEMAMRYPWIIAFFIFLPIIWSAGTRGHVADTYMYMGAFAEMPDSLNDIPTYIANVSKDKGFYFLSSLIKIVIGNNVMIYLTILAAIQGISILSIFRKYSDNYLVSVFLFVASTDYFSWMFNGIRQFTAVTIIFAATALMLNKKYKTLFVVILLASTIHQTALLMIPMVLIAQGKAWNKKTLFFIILSIIGVLFVERFTSFLDVALAETQYKNVVSDWQSWEDDGTNILRVLVYSVPTLLAFIGRKRIKCEENKWIHFITNMSILSTGLYVVSMFTSGIFIGRLPIYASLYGYILLPWEIEHIFTKESRKIVYILMVIFYLMFYYYQFHFGWKMI